MSCAKQFFFGQSLHFSPGSQQPKIKTNKYFLVLIKRKNGIHSTKRDEMSEVLFF